MRILINTLGNWSVLILFLGVIMVKAEDTIEKKNASSAVDFNLLLEPIWGGTTIYEESLFFSEKTDGKEIEANLLFFPEKIISVKSANGKLVFEEGIDYSVDKTRGALTVLKGSKIPSKTLKEMYPPANSDLPKYGHKRGDSSTFLIFGEGTFFHDLQVVVTYTHKKNVWQGYKPQFSGGKLPKTMAKLKSKDSFKVCLSGDSISQGYNASGFTKAHPYLPPYGNLVILGLEKIRGAKIDFKNFAIAGWTANNGVTNAEKIALEKPDLVLIAYGMNDSGSSTPEVYLANIKKIMSTIKDASPEVEFILVSPMLPNAEWHNPKLERFPAYRDALASICGDGVVLADMTSIWVELLKRKSFHDLTGNGVNHPNDFGHRIYAQVILELLTEAKRSN